MRVLGRDRGIIGPFLGPRRYVSERFGVSGERRPTGRVGSGAQPHGMGIGGDQASWNRSTWRLLGGDRGGGGGRGLLDGGDDLQSATALGAVRHVDLEHSFLKALPGFRPSGRRSPFKPAPGGFVSSRPQLMEAGAAGGGTSPWSAEGVGIDRQRSE